MITIEINDQQRSVRLDDAVVRADGSLQQIIAAFENAGGAPIGQPYASGSYLSAFCRFHEDLSARIMTFEGRLTGLYVGRDPTSPRDDEAVLEEFHDSLLNAPSAREQRWWLGFYAARDLKSDFPVLGFQFFVNWPESWLEGIRDRIPPQT